MKILIVLIVVIVLVMFLTEQNNHIVISRYKYKNNKIKKAFEGYKIVQISDLHNKDFHGRLSKKIEREKPDIIVITGDLIDASRTNLEVVKTFIYEIINVAKIYYVSGNHEHTSKKYLEVLEILENFGVIIVDDKYIKLEKKNESIGLVGIADPRINMYKKSYLKVIKEDYLKGNHSKYFNDKIRSLSPKIKTDFNILLSHRPEELKIYAMNEMDLVFSGHAHGGQIRLPFIGGLFSPKQGLFPKLTNGIHKEGNTSMVISRGLGNSRFPFRIFNRPEIVVIELNSKISL